MDHHERTIAHDLVRPVGMLSIAMVARLSLAAVQEEALRVGSWEVMKFLTLAWTRK
jgi:hypothetical protein